MDRIIGTTLLLLVVCVAAPAVAAIAYSAVPLLIAVVVTLGVLRLASRPSRHR